MMRPFDLNMEEVLEDWEVFHAVREIISNALDEQLMTKTADIESELTEYLGRTACKGIK